MCDRKKNNARWERQVMNRWWTKSKEKMWEVVNKKRKREKDINKEIEIREWDEYFREVMEGEEKNGKRYKERCNKGKERKGDRDKRGKESDKRAEEKQNSRRK